MVLRMLKKIHDKIIRRLRSKPSLATPWRGDFTMDVPLEVFEVTLCHMIQSNNFGHRFEETQAYTKVSITDTRKAVFIFNKMNVDCVIVSRAKLLKRSLGISDELARSGAPNENIVENHINITSLNVFEYLNVRYRQIFIP